MRLPAVLALLTLAACDTGLGSRLGAAPPPHEAYAAALREAGLDSMALGRAWLAAADSAVRDAEAVDLPAALALDAEAAAPRAFGWRIDLRAGEVLRVEVAPALADSGRLFVDLFRLGADRVEGTATAGDTLRLDRAAEADEALVLRVQPELLVGGFVAVRISTDPSLGFPVAGADDGAIRSRWGADRDGGARSHEGIDIFADRGTPAVAAASGRVTRVQETPIGGRVVWLRPDGAAVSLYYAHLDEQRVEAGARVEAGDTLGTVGNTGNAATTPPHLHFGVYGQGGAVDPEPFVVGRRVAPRTATPPR